MTKLATLSERRLMTMSEIVARLGVSLRKGWRLASSDKGFPRAIKVGTRGTRFDSHEFERYLDQLRTAKK
jgi:predicted DNA-binding transcriptional regulator AlpA